MSPSKDIGRLMLGVYLIAIGLVPLLDIRSLPRPRVADVQALKGVIR